MSTSVADILRGAGLVPIVPELSRQARTPESKSASRVPAVPLVPVEKCKGEAETTKASNPDTIRDRLLLLSAAEYRDPSLVRALSEAFLRDCDGMGDDALRALLSMLADGEERRALRRPKDDTAAILCRKCGPVWIHPAIASVLPVVDGWPRALGCPWCFIHPATGMTIPRPYATDAQSRHPPPSATPAQHLGSHELRSPIKSEEASQGVTPQCDAFRPGEGNP